MSASSLYDLSILASYPQVNTIEWYILPPQESPEVPLWVSIGHPKKQFPSIRFRHPIPMEEYRYKELLYVYDRSNDGQRTIYRQAHHEAIHRNGDVYRLLLQEDTLPSHRFPCSKDIQRNDQWVRRSFKINNRLYLMEDHHEAGVAGNTSKAGEACKSGKAGKAGEASEEFYCYYLKYQHAPQVDLTKMQYDLNEFLKRYHF